jgi:type II secretory pathway component PulF
MPPASSPAPFAYLATRADGGRSMGVRRARDERDLASQLRRERMVPVRSLKLPSIGGGGGSFSLKDQSELHVQLSQLLTRGVPLVEALEVTAACVNAATRPRVEKMRELVAAGSSFADACKAVDGFDNITIAVYRAAERTGDLGGAAKQLAVTTRRQLAIRGKAGTLLLYPIIVLTISLGISTLMLTVIVPRIGQALKSAAQVKLPWYTELVLGLGEFMRDQWPWIIATLLALGIAAYVLRSAIGTLFGRLFRRTPMVREVIMAQESARFFTVMAAMSRAGVTLGDSLAVGVTAVTHPKLHKQLVTLRTKLIEGGILRNLLENVDAFPLQVRRLMIAAERSGDLQNAFDTLAQDTSDELDRRSSRLLAMLEPLLIVLMFTIIGSLLLSIMIPLMKLSQQVM